MVADITQACVWQSAPAEVAEKTAANMKATDTFRTTISDALLIHDFIEPPQKKMSGLFESAHPL